MNTALSSPPVTLSQQTPDLSISTHSSSIRATERRCDVGDLLPASLTEQEVALDRHIREIGHLMESAHKRGDIEDAGRYLDEQKRLVLSRSAEHVLKLERARGIT